MTHKDLTLRQIVYILVFYDISFFWLLPLDSFQFNFLLRDSENDLYRVQLLNTPARNHFEQGFCPHIRTTILAQRDVCNKLKRSFTASILKWIVTLWIDFGATSSLRSTNAGVHAAPVAFPHRHERLSGICGVHTALKPDNIKLIEVAVYRCY